MHGRNGPDEIAARDRFCKDMKAWRQRVMARVHRPRGATPNVPSIGGGWDRPAPRTLIGRDEG